MVHTRRSYIQHTTVVSSIEGKMFGLQVFTISTSAHLNRGLEFGDDVHESIVCGPSHSISPLYFRMMSHDESYFGTASPYAFLFSS